MTHATLTQKVEVLRRKYAGTPAYEFAREVDSYIGGAAQNADDTIHLEKAATEDQWDAIFQSSLEMLLGDCRDTKVTNWFKKQGGGVVSWQHTRTMFPGHFRAAIAALGMKPAAAGRFLGLSDRTMRRFLRGERDVPTSVVLLLNCMITHRLRPLVPPKRA